MQQSGLAKWIIVAFILYVAASVFVLHYKVKEYEEARYTSEHTDNSYELFKFILAEKNKCNQEDSATDANNCHNHINSITERHVPPRDLIAQETVALATRGLLWVGAWQAIFSLGALMFLGFTVYQTGRIVRQSQAASLYAQQALEVAKDQSSAFIIAGDGNDDHPEANRLCIKLTNVGKTAATSITISFQQLDCTDTGQLGVGFVTPRKLTTHRLFKDHIAGEGFDHFPLKIRAGGSSSCFVRVTYKSIYDRFYVRDFVFGRIGVDGQPPIILSAVRPEYTSISSAEDREKELNQNNTKASKGKEKNQA